jgi:hypothetical protein
LWHVNPLLGNARNTHVPRDSWPHFTVSDYRLPQPGGPDLRIYILYEQGGPVIPQAQGSHFIASYESKSYGGGIRTRFHTGLTTLSEFESYVTTDGQSASLSWNKAPIWCLRPDFYYCQTVAGLLTWVALSYERTGLSFTIIAGPRQRSHSRIRVPWDSRPHFTVSDSRLPFSLSPTTRRATVEVFDPASIRDTIPSSKPASVIISSHGQRRKHHSLLYSNCFHGNMFVSKSVTE